MSEYMGWPFDIEAGIFFSITEEFIRKWGIEK